ncbi:DUF4406 domain-containing protein [Pseudomonas helleri]|uniref:DUF4406 domain-containing protein n=1 Tax=Pseudomonas helleri TaxID=1608996 RepID=UPI00242F0DF5|nr:DUF4406 domain-containing protein [Pseudomonas helleri]
MTNKQTIDGVSRERLAYWVEYLESAGFKDIPSEMRTLLDRPELMCKGAMSLSTGYGECSRCMNELRQAFQHQAGHERAVSLAMSREMRLYIAGPMTGLPEFNFPAFNAMAEKMRGAGWHVENPAEHGHVDGAEWADYLRYDIGRLATCEAIMLLPGWSKSRGARLEVSIAKELGMVFMFAEGAERETTEPTQAEQLAPTCCQKSAEEEALLKAGDYTPEELFGVGGKPSCPDCSKPATQKQDKVEGKRERFQKWILRIKHPVLGFLGGSWLTRGDDSEGYANEYVQGLWVAFKEFESQRQGEPVAWASPESLGGIRWRPQALDGLADGAPLYCWPNEQATPLAAEAAKAFTKGFNTLESGGGKYRINMQFQSREDAWGAFNVLARLKQLNTPQ